MTRTRVDSISFRGKVESRDVASNALKDSGDLVLVERGRPRMLVLRCPCGCGEDLLINLDSRAGHAWGFYRNRRGLTLYPSYWREGGCGSHFILWNNHIYWCYGWESEESQGWEVSEEVEQKVYAALPENEFAKYFELAELLGLIPWEVLEACRRLAKKGKAVSDKWPHRGGYRRTKSG